MYYYNFHIGDFIKDSAHLSLEEEAIYRRLIDLYYTTEQPIPLDINSVSRSIRARGNEEMIELILNEFFNKTAKGFKQKRIDKELKKYKEKSEKAAKSAKARWDKASKPCERTANALRTQCEGNANRKPITDNRKPLTNNSNIPYQQIADAYNANFAEPSNNPQVAKLNNDRKRLIKKLWFMCTSSEDEIKLTNNIDYWTRYFNHCSGLPFLQGDAERGEKHKTWRPDFNYIMKEGTYIKVLEGTL